MPVFNVYKITPHSPVNPLFLNDREAVPVPSGLCAAKRCSSEAVRESNVPPNDSIGSERAPCPEGLRGLSPVSDARLVLLLWGT
jgi:hypothetical protein